MMLCLNPAKVVRAWMKLKNQLSPLGEGALCLQIDEHTPLMLCVKKGEVSVEKTEQQPELTLTHEEAMHLLFTQNRFYAPKGAASIPESWFPLPLAILEADTF